MALEQDDPFDGLTLDEEFVQAATTIEPSASARARSVRRPRDFERTRRRNGRVALLLIVLLLVLSAATLVAGISRAARGLGRVSAPALATP